MESHLEARLWNDVFLVAQEALGVPRGTIRATVLIETILAAFEMDEILYELREHSAGLNCGRWDYIFSFIKKFRNRPDCVLPDRAVVTMDRPFLQLLRRAADPDLPSPRRSRHGRHGGADSDPQRPGSQRGGHGARARGQAARSARRARRHLGRASGARADRKQIFDAVMKGPNQLGCGRADVDVERARPARRCPTGRSPRPGLRGYIGVGVQYLEAWLRGNGCVPLYHLMEDAATAEICRAQLWQWLRHGAHTSDGQPITIERFDRLMSAELDRIHGEVGAARLTGGVFPTAARLFEQMTKSEAFDEFLTLPAYELLS